MDRLGTRARARLLHNFNFDADYNQRSICCSRFLAAIQRKKAFGQLKDSSKLYSSVSINIMETLFLLDNFFLNCHELYPEIKARHRLREFETQFFSILPVNLSCFELSERALLVFDCLTIVTKASFHDDGNITLDHCFSIPFQRSVYSRRSWDSATTLLAILYQHFARLSGLEAEIILLSTGCYCRIQDNSKTDGFFLMNIHNRGQLTSSVEVQSLHRILQVFPEGGQITQIDIDPISFRNLLSCSLFDPFSKEDFETSSGDEAIQLSLSINLGIKLLYHFYVLSIKERAIAAIAMINLIATDYPFDVSLFDWFANQIEPSDHSLLALKHARQKLMYFSSIPSVLNYFGPI